MDNQTTNLQMNIDFSGLQSDKCCQMEINMVWLGRKCKNWMSKNDIQPQWPKGSRKDWRKINFHNTDMGRKDSRVHDNSL